MRTISLRSAQNRFDKQGDEVCFEEFRAYRNVENSKKNVSILLRTKLNAQYTMRVAPFDVVGDNIFEQAAATEQRQELRLGPQRDGDGERGNDLQVRRDPQCLFARVRGRGVERTL